MDPNTQPAPQQAEYDPKTKVGNRLTVTQPGEHLVCEVKRHPIGIISIYVAVGMLLIVVAVLAFLVAPHFITDSSGSGSTTTKIGAVVFLMVTVFSLAFALISTKVYWDNSWVVTSDSLTQIERDSLFKRESSQLSLGNLEDVTAEQNGILPHMFNYGWLRVETASEQGKFVFQYCPNPNYFAQQILAARESFEQGRRGESQQGTYRSQDSYAQPQQQAGDPGYGAFPQPQPQLGPEPQAGPPPAALPPTEPAAPATSPVDYPDESADQGVDINA